MLIAFKLKLALACAAGLAGPLAVALFVMENDAADASLRDRQAVVELHLGEVSCRVNGDFTRAGKQAAAPLVQVKLPRPLAIMRHQVSSSDYQRCVDDGACRALDRGVVVAADRPAVQVSWHDANGYAAWLSRKTGEAYRLPTDEEWAFAAGSKFKDDGIAVDDNDPPKRWIARYEREAERAPFDHETRTFGSFGANENGLQDVGGNVREWTASCFVRRVLDDAGKVVSDSPNCGVRVVEGQQRAYVTDFIRDAKAGGCAVGVPPDNLGFRLVLEREGARPAARRSTRDHQAQSLALIGPNMALTIEIDHARARAAPRLCNFQANANGPDVLRFERLFLADEQSLIPRSLVSADKTYNMAVPQPPRPPRRSIASVLFRPIGISRGIPLLD